MKIITHIQAFSVLMRNLNRVALRMPRKGGEKVLYIISRLENLMYFPNDIITEDQYPEDEDF